MQELAQFYHTIYIFIKACTLKIFSKQRSVYITYYGFLQMLYTHINSTHSYKQYPDHEAEDYEISQSPFMILLVTTLSSITIS